MRCIICLQSDPSCGFTLEHIFPDAIGGTLTTRAVCKDCNDKLGRLVDVTITDHFFVKVKRVMLGLCGKTGRIPDPFKNAVLKSEPSKKVRWKINRRDAAKDEIYTFPEVRKSVEESGSRLLSIAVNALDEAKLGPIINTALSRAGGKQLSPEELAQLPLKRVKTENVALTIPVSIDPVEYRRGLLKIAYELAFLWLGESFLDDQCAAALRTCIFDLNDPQIRTLRARFSLVPENLMLPLWDDRPDVLVAASVPCGTTLSIYVRIFQAFEAIVVVTENAGIYQPCDGRFVLIDPKTGETLQE